MIGLPKASALAGIGKGGLIGGPRHADRLGADADAAAFEVGKRDLVAFALGAEHQIGGQLDVLEDELRGIGGALAELVLDPATRKPGVSVGTRKALMPLLPRSGSVTAKTIAILGILARGDELLGAVQHPTVAVAPRPGLDRRGVGAGLRLRQAETREHLALRHRLEKPPLLLVRAVLQHRHAADRVLHAQNGRDRTLAGGDFLHHQGIADMVGARPAIFLRHQHPHEAEPAELGHRFRRKLLLAIPFRGEWREPRAGKVVGDIAQHALLVGESHGDVLSRLAVTSISIFIRGSTRPQIKAVAAGRIAPNTSPRTGTIAGQSAASGR